MTTATATLSRTEIVTDQLNKLHAYGCQEALIIDGEGLIVAPLEPSEAAQNTAALAAQLLRMASRTIDQTNDDDSDEVVVRTSGGMKLVCRSFTMGYQNVSLVCTLPYKSAHRRVTNQAIRAIEQVWGFNGGANGAW